MMVFNDGILALVDDKTQIETCMIYQLLFNAWADDECWYLVCTAI